MALYSGPGTVLLNGLPLLQTESMTYALDSGNKPVMTTALGYAGFSVGPTQVNIAVTNAAPTTGLEVDWDGLVASHTEVTMGFRFAGKTRMCRGDVRDLRLETGVDRPNQVSFTFHGALLQVI